ncbi:conserved hypothetical protein [Alkaliphilus metalliredigens QYMF]|uniref:Glycosyl transferase, family 4 n=1 Tax=Alkaliphilus metalliredigens (strain QYMF) TaxID=293826 RepID=A6TR54_ALKMQ|nr:glycosyl transferase [Alkaliphilus metalliredigens]ABR48672.1 conserved hypothetical protein [Alkaliphilus metalliredigens QYMF]
MEIMLLILSATLTYVMKPYLRQLLIESGMIGKNYENKEIPVGMGLLLIPIMTIQLFLIQAIYPFYFKVERFQLNVLLLFFIGILMMAFLGLLDDTVGSRDTLGFKGHLGQLVRGRLTTGGLKAVLGGLTALLISSILSSSIIELILNTLLLGLFTNLINLLDLRPGRAMKGYISLLMVFLILGITYESRIIFFTILGYCIVYLPQDLRAEYMMGDVGSNTLGMTLGIMSMLSFSSIVKYLLLFILIIIHMIAEKYSISKIIDGNSILRFIDNLGRKTH